MDTPRLELVAEGFSFPTSVATDDDGVIYVAESGLPFGGASPGGRVWRLDPDGSRTLLRADLHVPVNGLTYRAGFLYISEGGHPGRISRIDRDGGYRVVLDHLPGPGNYHTNMVAFGPDGRLYFSQGAMTNTGIVGLDAYELGWLRRLPHAHDIPGYDIVLAGINVDTPDPFAPGPGARARTGGFVPFGMPTEGGQHVQAGLPCTAAILRCEPDGRGLALVAWGLRNAYGLAFLPDGRLLATDQGADDRGSRPVGNAPDMVFHVRPGAWYGWPDFVGGEPVTDSRYTPARGSPPRFLLANHNALPPPERPLLRFPPHVAATKFAVVPAGEAPLGGQLVVALFGDEAPMTAPRGPRMGRAIARIDPADWSLHDLIGEPLIRPIDVHFSAAQRALFVLDFGRFEMDTAGAVVAAPGSGTLWRLRFAQTAG